MRGCSPPVLQVVLSPEAEGLLRLVAKGKPVPPPSSSSSPRTESTKPVPAPRRGKHEASTGQGNNILSLFLHIIFLYLSLCTFCFLFNRVRNIFAFLIRLSPAAVAGQTAPAVAVTPVTEQPSSPSQRQDLLADIRKGTPLKSSETSDRSSPHM